MKTTLLILLFSFSLSTQAQFTVHPLSIQLPKVNLDSIQAEAGMIAYENSTLWYCDGVNWIDIGSAIECQNRVKLGFGTFSGDPSQADFISIFGEPDYHFVFTVVSGGKCYQGSYIPDFGYFYLKLKQ